MLQFRVFQPFKDTLCHAVLTRGTSFENFRMNGVTPVSFDTQLHSSRIVIATQPHSERSCHPERREGSPSSQQHILRGDALITALPNTPLMIRIADCASILLFDPENKVIANIHAGWRGLAKKIIHKVVLRMGKSFGSVRPRLLAAISPMLGPCCSRFTEPKKELPRHMHRFINPKNHVNLWAATESALQENGLAPANIENPRICTFCSPAVYPSFRRDNTSERFATVIMLT